jgi:branched-chain amino acid transport system permease protein
VERLLQQMANGLIIGSTYAVVALGFSLVFTVMRVVNLAHPEIFMIGMFLALLVAVHVTQNLIVILVLVAAGTALLGLVVERIALRPLQKQGILMPLIGTAGISIFLQYTVAAISGPDERAFPRLIPLAGYSAGPVTVTSWQLTNFCFSILMMLAVSLYVRRTKLGRATRAVAERPEVAAAFGVDVNRVAQISVALATLLAGLAGVSIALLYGVVSPFVGGLYGLKSFVCMLVAGNRHIEGVMAVGLLLGVTEALVTGFISANLRDAISFLLLIGILYFRPKGLFGSYDY